MLCSAIVQYHRHHSVARRQEELNSAQSGPYPMDAPDLTLQHLHLLLPAGSPAEASLRAVSGGSDADPRGVLASRCSRARHLLLERIKASRSVSYRLHVDEFTLIGSLVEGPSADTTAFQVLTVAEHTPPTAPTLTLTSATTTVSRRPGTKSDTHRLVDWYAAIDAAAIAPRLFATLRLVEKMETAERDMAS